MADDEDHAGLHERRPRPAPASPRCASRNDSPSGRGRSPAERGTAGTPPARGPGLPPGQAFPAAQAGFDQVRNRDRFEPVGRGDDPGRFQGAEHRTGIGGVEGQARQRWRRNELARGPNRQDRGWPIDPEDGTGPAGSGPSRRDGAGRPRSSDARHGVKEPPAGDDAGDADGFDQARCLRPAAPGDVERGPVCDARPDDRQAERHVHRAVKSQGFQGDVP